MQKQQKSFCEELRWDLYWKNNTLCIDKPITSFFLFLISFLMAKATSKSAPKKKKAIKLPFGTLYVTTTPNNTLVTLTDPHGNKVTWGGTGMAGFKGAKQSTPYAAEVLTQQIMKEAKEQFGLKQVRLILKGVWLGRDGVFKGINNIGWIDILSIQEKTGIQFGGCQGKRPKRN